MSKIGRDVVIYVGIPVLAVVVIGLALGKVLDTSPLPVPQLAPSCRCATHTDQRDSVVWSCRCPEGVLPTRICLPDSVR